MTHYSLVPALRVCSLALMGICACAVQTASVIGVEPPTEPVAAKPGDDVNDPTYDLRYKLQTGDVLQYDIQHRASVRSTIEQVTQSAQTSTDSSKLWKVTDVLPNGEIEFMNVIERVHMINELPDRAAAEYDSERDTTPPPGFDDVAKAIGVPLSVVRMTPRGKIVDRKIKHRQTGAAEDDAVVIRLPDEPVAVGATWDEPFEVTVQLESGGTRAIQTRRHYKLASVTGGMAIIEVTYQVLSPVDSFVESQLIQRLMSGKANFDVARGRLVSQQMDVDKRIIGFAGPTSSMQYVMRMEEKLVERPLEAPKGPQSANNSGGKTADSRGSVHSSTPKSTSTGGARPPVKSAARPQGSQRGAAQKGTSGQPRGPAKAKGSRR